MSKFEAVYSPLVALAWCSFFAGLPSPPRRRRHVPAYTTELQCSPAAMLLFGSRIHQWFLNQL